MIRFILPVLIFCLASTGCTSITNFVVTPHPKSLREGRLTIAVDCEPDPAAFGPALLAPVAGLIVEGAKKLIKAEAKQYETSYSAVRHFEWAVTRCPVSGTREDWLDLSASLTVSANQAGARLTNIRVTPRAVKSKVAGLSLPATIWKTPGLSVAERLNAQVGYLWPWMWLHTLYGQLIDSGVYETDISLRMRFDAVVDGEKKRTNAKLAELDIQYGKFDITREAEDRQFETGWFPTPLSRTSPVPTTLTVTIMEANELGDMIGKGADLIDDKKESIVKKLEGFLSP